MKHTKQIITAAGASAFAAALLAVPAGAEHISTGYYYSRLDDTEKNFYAALDRMCGKFLTDGEDAYSYEAGGYHIFPYMIKYYDEKTGMLISDERAGEIYQAFFYEHPEYFYLAKNYVTCKEYSRETSSFIYYIAPKVIDRFANGKERIAAKREIDRITSLWLEDIDSEKTPLDKERRICEILCENSSYKSEKGDIGAYDRSMASAVLDGETVCSGYTQAMTYLCERAGIECFAAEGSSHVWNFVRLYGNWYETDVTWMDERGGSDCFNRSHESLLACEGAAARGTHEYSGFEIPFGLPPTLYDEVIGPDYAITAESTEGGSFSLSGVTAGYNDTVRITAHPQTGCEPDEITVHAADGSIVAVNGTEFLMPPCDASVSVTFRPSVYSITAHAAENGYYSVSADSAVYADTVTVETFPDKGCTDSDIIVRTASGADIPVSGGSFIMPADSVDINVSFDRHMYKAEAVPSGHGRFSLSAYSAGYNDIISVYAPAYAAEYGYLPCGIAVNGVNIGTDIGYFTMPDEDISVEVRYERAFITDPAAEPLFRIEKGYTGNMDIILSAQLARCGETVKVSAVSYGNSGDFVLMAEDMNGGSTEIKNGCFVMPAGNVTVYAVFEDMNGGTLEGDN